MQTCRMIKNKTLDMKIIFKAYLKILKTSSKHFRLPNKILFYRTLENSFRKLFSNFQSIYIYNKVKEEENEKRKNRITQEKTE